MNHMTFSPRITLARAGQHGTTVEVGIDCRYGDAHASLCASSYAIGAQHRVSIDMTPTEMLLLADQLTTAALQIEARTAQRALQPTVLEAV